MVEILVTGFGNRTTQVLLDGAQELLGQENYEKLIGLLPADLYVSIANGVPGAREYPGALMQLLEARYGTQGGRGLALRIGRTAFKYALQQFGDESGLRSMSFRLLPITRRLETGLKILAQTISAQLGDSIQVVDRGTEWEWISEKCPVCQGLASNDPCCYLTAGFLEAFMTWAAGGRFYRVREVSCRAAGSSACVFRIDKKPVD